MKCKHEQMTEDGGGKLHVTAENKAEIVEVIQHFRLFDKDTPEGILAMADALKGDTYTHTDYSAKRPWFLTTSALDWDSTKPYWDLLCKITGFEELSIPPDMDLTPFHPKRLCHTHIVQSVKLEHGHIVFEALGTGEPWNGRTAAEYADEKTADYVKEHFGFRRFEREFIQAGNGQYIHNPKYATTHHKASPGLGAPWFWKVLFEWWMANKASEKQRAILEAINALKVGNDPDWMIRKGGGEQASLVGFSLYYRDDAGKIDWDGKGTKAGCMSWDDFAKLAGDTVNA